MTTATNDDDKSDPKKANRNGSVAPTCNHVAPKPSMRDYVHRRIRYREPLLLFARNKPSLLLQRDTPRQCSAAVELNV